MDNVNNSGSNKNLTIVIDTREQKPYKFQHTSVVGTLKSGDYSIKGYEKEFAIERKSLADWAGSITQGRERFERELVRLSDYSFAAVIIETDLRSVWKARLYSRINRKSLVNTALKWTVKYNIPIVFVSNRTNGAYAVEAYAEAFWKYNVVGQINGKTKSNVEHKDG